MGTFTFFFSFFSLFISVAGYSTLKPAEPPPVAPRQQLRFPPPSDKGLQRLKKKKIPGLKHALSFRLECKKIFLIQKEIPKKAIINNNSAGLRSAPLI